VSFLPNGLAKSPILAFAGLKPDPTITLYLVAVIADILPSRSERAGENGIYVVKKRRFHGLDSLNPV
jgi:hypothetical protein